MKPKSETLVVPTQETVQLFQLNQWHLFKRNKWTVLTTETVGNCETVTEGMFHPRDCTSSYSCIAMCFTLLFKIKHKNNFLFSLQQKNFSV